MTLLTEVTSHVDHAWSFRYTPLHNSESTDQLKMRPRALLLMHKLINSAQRRPSTKIHDQKRLHFLVTNLKFLKGAQCFATGQSNRNKLHLVIVT